VLTPKNSKRGQLMSQYVCARITRMDDINIALFDYDRNNTLYFFILNADEQIYLRYGGRDAASQDTYLNLDSLELALERGLLLHQQYQRGELKKKELPPPKYPKEYPLLVERTFKRNQCVECHLIGDFQNQHRELDGTLDKLVHMFRSPDIKTIGIHLDVPRGLVIKEATGAAQAAGMRPGDRIAAVNGTPVWTFGDLQWYYDQVPRAAKQARFTVERAGAMEELTVNLPPRWWLTDIRYKQLTVDPRVYFDSRPLSPDEKQKLGLNPDGFASEVTRVDAFAQMMKSHQLQVGDIVYAVDGVETDEYAHTAELFIKLRKRAGDSMKLSVLRAGQRLDMDLKTFRMSFRK
jgi:hypothetical protein